MITESVESVRGCGYRKQGGLYMIGGKFGSPCGKLPIPLSVCPCCGAGVKFSRGFAWISSAMVETHPCSYGDECKNCPVWSGKLEYYGLLWVGEKFYSTPEHFIEEGNRQGISKRISAIPKDFEIGTDWVLLAHRKAVKSVNAKGEIEMMPGIFQAFKPTHFEYVVSGQESKEELDRLTKRGIKLVKVIRDTEAQVEIKL